MVKGLDLFRGHFAELGDQYVLIGGTAATLAMAEAGLEFRATKDLDIVLHMEALTPAFGTAFWAFVEKGGYKIRQSGQAGGRFSIDSRNPRPRVFLRCSSCSVARPREFALPKALT